MRQISGLRAVIDPPSQKVLKSRRSNLLAHRNFSEGGDYE